MHNLEFSKIKCNFLFNPFFASFATHSINIKDSSFSNFLSNAIKIDNYHDYADNVYTKRLKVSKEGNLTILRCTFKKCINQIDENGGAFVSTGCNTFILYCNFENNSALYSGAAEIQNAPLAIVNSTTMIGNHAERFGAMMADGTDPSDISRISYSNFTYNSADKWIGAIRVQHNGGSVKFSNFIGNMAESYGAYWDFSHKPSYRNLEFITFINNTANQMGAAFTSYHLLFRGVITNCVFSGNRNENNFPGMSILIFSDSSYLKVENCSFEREKDIEIYLYFNTSTIDILDSNQFNV